MNERGLVEVPENAVRDEPIAFGLTGVQLGICGVTVVVAAALNLLPIWEPLRIVLIVLGAGPIAITAALPIQGEPAYRWLIRAVRYLRSRRLWQAQLATPSAPSQEWLDND
ncbi:MAG: PrgI family protein [Chloroflexi bacterium]|nr:PrgI family protein [Chloroflexota bacterium]